MLKYTEEKIFTQDQVQQLFLSVGWVSGKYPDYQGQGIAGQMIEYIKEKYKNFLYIEGMPEDKNNVPFYVKHGFSVMENGVAIQICNDTNR